MKYIGYLLIALLVVVVDQVSKRTINASLDTKSVIEVLSVFKIVLVYNYGAAFGFLNDAGGWQHGFLVLLALVFSVVLLVWIWKEHGRNGRLALALTSILGGVVGNLIDRVQLGYVVDFLLLHYKDWYFPSFNVADVAITFGAILMIVDSLFPNQPAKR